MEIRVRPATENDFEAVNSLRAQVNALHVQGRPDIFKPGFCEELQAHLKTYLASENNAVIVAEADGQIAGFAMVDYIARPEGPYTLARSFYHVAEIGVDPAHQRRGVATALTEYMKNDALQRGFSKIELDVWAFNESALTFYKKAGFTTYRRYMELPLADTQVTFPETWRDGDLKYAVIVALYRGKWIFCRHRERNTWELPGGHREPGETIEAAARRELYEETGAVDFDLAPLGAYAVVRSGVPTCGMLYAARVRALEGTLHSEIETIKIAAALPASWTYPDIQPKLLCRAAALGYGAAPAGGGTVHLICGQICSGKSTYARRLAGEKNAVILSSDDLTAVLPCDHDLSYPIVRNFMVKKALEIAHRGTDVILDWGFWHSSDRAEITETVRESGLDCKWYYMQASRETINAHAAKRNAAPGPGEFYADDGLLQKCAAQFEPPLPGEMDVVIDIKEEDNP